jgi:hypothetical protein
MCRAATESQSQILTIFMTLSQEELPENNGLTRTKSPPSPVSRKACR